LADLTHWFGSDLSAGPTGDLALSSGVDETEQSLVRRLMTAAGTYIQNIGYGAGLGKFVGSPILRGQIIGVIKRQMKKETTILQNPPPVVTLTTDGNTVVTATIQYTSALTNQTQTLQFPVGQ
jgi:hypothetical protein